MTSRKPYASRAADAEPAGCPESPLPRHPQRNAALDQSSSSAVVPASARARAGHTRRTARAGRFRASHFRALVELAPDATVVTDGEGCIQLVNRQTEVLFGYARDQLLGQPVEMLLPQRLRALHTDHRAAYAAAPHTRPMDTGLQLLGRHCDGHEFSVEVSLSPLDADGGPLVIACVRDISAVQRLQAAHRATEQANQELRRLLALTDTALAHLSLDALLPALLERVHEAMAVDDVTILLLDAEGQTLVVRATLDLEAAVAAQLRVPVGQGFAGRIAASRQPLIVNDLSTFPVVHPFLQEHLRSVVGVPLLLGAHVLGVLHAGTREPHEFTERDVQLLQRAADRVATAVEHARLYEGAQTAYAAEQRACLAAEAARQQAEAALAHAQMSEMRFQRLMEANIIGVAVSDGEQVLEANDAFLQLLGYTREDLEAGRLSRFTLNVTEQLSATAYAIHEARTHGAYAPFEKEYVHRDGTRVPVLVAVVRLEGEPARFVRFVVDLTERKRLERDREAARANELALREVNQHMEAFLATAAHDLRNPVQAADGYVHIALRRLEQLQAQQAERAASVQPAVCAQVEVEAPTGAQRSGRADLMQALDECLRAAAHGTEQLSRLVTRLFDVARARAGTLELQLAPCDLAALVREQLEAQRMAMPHRSILLEMPGTPGTSDRPEGMSVPVLADADRLGQVLANYLTNALKYAPEDAPITVRLDVEEGEQLARVAVRDAGPGLPPEEQQRVWEPFHRAPGIEVRSPSAEMGGSLGLGLHICKTIVEGHRGHVGVKSAVGHGATFWFTLPVVPSPDCQL